MKFPSFLAGFDTIEEGMYTCSKQVADALMIKWLRLQLRLVHKCVLRIEFQLVRNIGRSCITVKNYEFKTGSNKYHSDDKIDNQ